MIQTFKYASIALDGVAWGIEDVLDGLGIPETRGENTLVPFVTGRRFSKKRKDHKTLILGMYVSGKNPANVNAAPTEAQLEINKDYLAKLFGKRGLFKLERIMPDASVREAWAEVIADINFTTVSKTVSKFTVEFSIPAGLFTAATAVTYTLSETALNHAGTAAQDSMTITMTGPLVNPRLENKTNGIWIQYLGTLAAEESLVIKTADYSVMKGDQNMIAAFRHGGDASWFILEPGANTLELTSEGAGVVAIAYKPAYY